MTNNLKAERTLTAEELQEIIAEARDFCRHPNVHFHYTDGARVMSALADALESLSTQQPMGEVTDGWQTMDTAPLNGKHCILAVKEPSGFVYSVQGAFQSGQWNAVHRDNVDPIFWKPNARLPEGWESAKPFSALHPNQESGE